ncbi:MAG: hypothetical protein ABEH88_08140 [Halobacteriales archaeon]
MVTLGDTTIATVVALTVTASFPFYLYGAWIILQHETVTWDVLTHHLKFVGTGLVMTTLPVATWMAPRLIWGSVGFDSFTALHVFLGVQAYALLTFALTGIVRIFQVKRRHDLYNDPDPEMSISELHENMGAWRFRLRAGVFGYVIFWLLAWVVGTARYVLFYFG